MVNFKLVSDFTPKGDQPSAIKELVDGIRNGKRFQTLLGATGTGKTYTMAQVISQTNLPTLVTAPNKLLAAQLYQEFKEFFPHNAVHYYISYFDYYQPEAYLPQLGKYIEKDSSVNEEIMKYRLATTHSLLTRQDVIAIASVSSIYGIGNPNEWARKSFVIEKGMEITRNELMLKLISIQYERNDIDFTNGKIRVRGDTVDIFPGYLDSFYRVSFFGDEIESITEMEPLTNKILQEVSNLKIFPTREYVAAEEIIDDITKEIEEELEERIKFFKKNKKWAEAQRLEERTRYDIEMLREIGYCKGIENYSRYLDRRKPGEQPACLYDYFPEEFLLIIDESHIAIPQIKGMIKGDQSRKQSLVDYGFRLPSALDNRPLRFEEWEKKLSYVICTSATPGPYELKRSKNVWVDQVIRPTGLVDPLVEVRPVKNQIDDLLAEIRAEIQHGNRVLITTLTKRMAENIADYYSEIGIKIEYLHSDIDTVERMNLIRNLRAGVFDVVVGINLLREGLDLPEVGLVAILDGDKEGFLRDTRSLIQTIGRASRNAEGRAIIYADKFTKSIKNAIEETNRRRNKQLLYNKKHGITPQTIHKRVQEALAETPQDGKQRHSKKAFSEILQKTLQKNASEEEILQDLERSMLEAAKDLEFEVAAILRDVIREVKSNRIKSSEISQVLNSKLAKINTQFKDPQYNNKSEEDFPEFYLLGTTEHVTKRENRKIVLKKMKRSNET
ncbi:MAG: excinuclease ABC subunit B [Promethearchaeia archaeon]|nr:MAG: excinuclease ABC subunit B [Candidatus Lokiarchaeia archaeon]